MTNETTKELVIDENNFHKYFFDARQNKPQPGQVLAKFTAWAVFSDGPEKRDIIALLKKGKAEQAAMIMNRIHCARVPDCYRVCREMSEDLLSMTEDEVAKKEYGFVLEAMYYTKREYVPVDDPRWEIVNTLHYDEKTKTFKSS